MKIKSSLKRGSHEKTFFGGNDYLENNKNLNKMKSLNNTKINNFKMVRFATELTTVKKFYIYDTPKEINLQNNDNYLSDNEICNYGYKYINNDNTNGKLKDSKYLLNQLGLDFDDMDDLIDLMDLNKVHYSKTINYNYNFSNNDNNNNIIINRNAININEDDITDDETIVDTLNLDDFSLSNNTDDFMNFRNFGNYDCINSNNDLNNFNNSSNNASLENLNLNSINWELISKNLTNMNEIDNMTQIKQILEYQNIKLVYLTVVDGYLKGAILVNNLNYEKNIEIKFTFNDWSNINYINAIYDSSMNDTVDKFLFTINLNSFNFYLKCHDLINASTNESLNNSEIIDLKFCCRYIVNNETYYDNNDYDNYELKFNIIKESVNSDLLCNEYGSLFNRSEFISPVETPESTPEVIDLNSLNILDEIISTYSAYATENNFNDNYHGGLNNSSKPIQKKSVSRIFNDNTDYYNTSPLKHLYHNDPIRLKPVSINKVMTNTMSSSSMTDSLASSISPSISSSTISSSSNWEDDNLLLTSVSPSPSDLQDFQNLHKLSKENNNNTKIKEGNATSVKNYYNNISTNLNFEPLTWSDYDSSLSSSMSSSFSDFNEVNNEFNYNYKYDYIDKSGDINDTRNSNYIHNSTTRANNNTNNTNEFGYYTNQFDDFIRDQDTITDTLSINSNETLTINNIKSYSNEFLNNNRSDLSSKLDNKNDTMNNNNSAGSVLVNPDSTLITTGNVDNNKYTTTFNTFHDFKN